MSPAELDLALRRYLRERPLAFALWRYSELVPLSQLDWRGEVLDLACGDGLFGTLLLAGARARGELKLTGLDLDGAELAKARRHHSYDALHEGRGEALPFGAAQFDRVLSNCALEHFGAPAQALGEIHRVLKPGGKLVATVPAPDLDRFLFGSRLLAPLGQGLANHYAQGVRRVLDHAHVLEADAWRALLTNAGFAAVEVLPYAAPSVVRAFDACAAIEVGALLWQRLSRRWHVLPKPAALGGWVRRLVGDGRPAAGGGWLIVAERPRADAAALPT